MFRAKKAVALALGLLVLLSSCVPAPAGGETTGDDPLTWEHYYDLGVRYLSQGNYQEAVIAFIAAIEIDPKRAEAYQGLAEGYAALGDTDRAIESLEQGWDATQDPHFLDLLEGLLGDSGMVYYENEQGAIAHAIFAHEGMVQPQELTVFGTPFNEAELDWVLAAAGGSYTVLPSLTNDYTDEGHVGYTTHWIYPPVGPGVSEGDEILYYAHHGITVMTNSRDGGNGTCLNAVVYGGDNYAGYYRMDVPPELRGLALDDSGQAVLTKLGIPAEHHESLLALGSFHLVSSRDNPGQAEPGYTLQNAEIDDESYPMQYTFTWMRNFYTISLTVCFDPLGQLKRIQYSASDFS